MFKKLICIAYLALFAGNAQGSDCVIHLFQPRSPFQVERIVDRLLQKNGFSSDLITPAIRNKVMSFMVVDGVYSPTAASGLSNWLAYQRQLAKDAELLGLLNAYSSTRQAHVRTHFNIQP